ncbi:hypothetical protein AAG570_012906 [Ranatra chinensis]|uniref:Uncharacterized protein n=1 Tax=Ranatra chinensis TaxID=642074 RepID=A0ABD0YFC1_9HEMI
MDRESIIPSNGPKTLIEELSFKLVNSDRYPSIPQLKENLQIEQTAMEGNKQKQNHLKKTEKLDSKHSKEIGSCSPRTFTVKPRKSSLRDDENGPEKHGYSSLKAKFVEEIQTLHKVGFSSGGALRMLAPKFIGENNNKSKQKEPPIHKHKLPIEVRKKTDESKPKTVLFPKKHIEEKKNTIPARPKVRPPKNVHSLVTHKSILPKPNNLKPNPSCKVNQANKRKFTSGPSNASFTSPLCNLYDTPNRSTYALHSFKIPKINKKQNTKEHITSGNSRYTTKQNTVNEGKEMKTSDENLAQKITNEVIDVLNLNDVNLNKVTLMSKIKSVLRRSDKNMCKFVSEKLEDKMNSISTEPFNGIPQSNISTSHSESVSAQINNNSLFEKHGAKHLIKMPDQCDGNDRRDTKSSKLKVSENLTPSDASHVPRVFHSKSQLSSEEKGSLQFSPLSGCSDPKVCRDEILSSVENCISEKVVKRKFKEKSNINCKPKFNMAKSQSKVLDINSKKRKMISGAWSDSPIRKRVRSNHLIEEYDNLFGDSVIETESSRCNPPKKCKYANNCGEESSNSELQVRCDMYGLQKNRSHSKRCDKESEEVSMPEKSENVAPKIKMTPHKLGSSTALISTKADLLEDLRTKTVNDTNVITVLDKQQIKICVDEKGANDDNSHEGITNSNTSNKKDSGLNLCLCKQQGDFECMNCKSIAAENKNQDVNLCSTSNIDKNKKIDATRQPEFTSELIKADLKVSDDEKERCRDLPDIENKYNLVTCPTGFEADVNCNIKDVMGCADVLDKNVQEGIFDENISLFGIMASNHNIAYLMNMVHPIPMKIHEDNNSGLNCLKRDLGIHLSSYSSKNRGSKLFDLPSLLIDPEEAQIQGHSIEFKKEYRKDMEIKSLDIPNEKTEDQVKSIATDNESVVLVTDTAHEEPIQKLLIKTEPNLDDSTCSTRDNETTSKSWGKEYSRVSRAE